MRSSPLSVALALAAAAGPAWGAEEWTPAGPGYAWSFPRDHRAHAGYRNEWWYVTGIVESAEEPARRLAYQVTFFRIGLAPGPRAAGSSWAATDVVMGHAAIADLGSGEHRFSEVVYRAVPLLAGFGEEPDPVLVWSRGPPGTEGRWELALAGDGFLLSMEDRASGMALRLALSPERAPLLEGPGGLSRKSSKEGAASLYYSVTRLATSGAVTLGGSTCRVRGESWMDREFGSSQLASDQSGWDWFALRLSDGRDLMLYVLRGRDGAPDFQSGTLADAGGHPTYLSGGDFRVRVTRRWKSPGTGADYPAGWEVEVPGAGLSLRVDPASADQENRGGRGPYYWEGAVRVAGPRGERAGEGFVELTGYGAGNRPPI